MDPVLTLKVMPPRPRKDIIARPRLDRRFTRHSDVPVVIVDAPAGYGKTLLLAQWRRAAMAEGAAAAWLTLDAQDDERRLLEGVVLAIRQATGRADFALGIDWGRNEVDWSMKTAAAILADWSRLARPVVLILDDFDRLTDPAARAIGRYFVANMPPNGRILIGVRAVQDRPWVLELQAYGQLAIVGRADLAFTLEESMAFLRQRLPGGVLNNIGAQIHERAAGWAIGLELFAATVAETNDPGAALTLMQDGGRAFAGSLIADGARSIAGYLIDSATAAWPEDRKAFLVEISILAHLHVDLCTAVTARPDAAQIVAELRARSALIVDGEDESWFRLHHLAVDHLREEAARLPEEHRKRLHHRAAAWLAANRFWEQATNHALEAGETKLAFDCIERCVDALLAAGKFDLVDSWFKRLPEAEIANRRNVRLAVAIRLAITGSSQFAHLIEDLLQSSEPKLRFTASIVHAIAAGHADDPDAGRAALREWREEPATDKPVILRGYYNVRRWLDALENRPRKPRPWGEGSSPVFGAAAFGGSVTLHQHGLVHLNNAQPRLATRLLTPALARYEASLGRRSPPAVLVALTLASALCEQDEFAQARVLLADRLDLIDPGVLPDGLALGFTAAAAVAQHDGQANRALDLLELLLARAKARNLHRIAAVATTALVRFHAAAGRAEPCERLVYDLKAVAEAACERRSLNAMPILVELRLATARACWAKRDGQATLKFAEAAIEVARGAGRRQIEFEARFLRAAALFDLTGETTPDLAEVASLADTLALRRTLREANQFLPPTLRRVIAAGTAEEDRSWTPDAEPVAPRPLKPVTSDASAMLTAREAQVLLLLSRGLSNKEIANALDIGDGTIKWHLKNLFLKFDATDRKHVVARARLLGLLETA